MRSNSCLTILHVSIMVLLIGTLGADNCDEGVKVHRNTVYEASLGHSLTMKCPVDFCTSSQPAVSWLKLEGNGSFIPVDVSSSSRITANWEELSPGKGISYLIFKKVVINDTGQYRCQSGNDVSHNINVSVKGDDEFTTVAVENNTTKGGPAPLTISWHCVYRIIAFLAFILVVTVICLASTQRCRGVCGAGEPRSAPDPSCQPSRGSSRVRHIYENDPYVP